MASPWIPIAGVSAIALALYFASSSRAPDVKDYEPLPVSANELHPTRYHGDKADATLTITSPDGSVVDELALFNGVLTQPKFQLSEPVNERFTYRLTTHRYAQDVVHDVGAWLGFRVATTHGDNPKGDVGLDVGIRYSPIRLFAGVVAVDLLVSPRQAGGGVSLYAPANLVPPVFQRFGLGMAYLADYRGGAGWSPYLSLSTRF